MRRLLKIYPNHARAKYAWFREAPAGALMRESNLSWTLGELETRYGTDENPDKYRGIERTDVWYDEASTAPREIFESLKR